MNWILQFIEYKKFSVYQFEKKIGVRSTIQKAISSNSNLGSNLLSKIVAEFPEINPAWLITGKGEMLLAGENTLTGRPIVDQAQRVFDLEKIKFLQESVDMLKKTNELQEQISENLKQRLMIFENEKKLFENNKSNL